MFDDIPEMRDQVTDKLIMPAVCFIQNWKYIISIIRAWWNLLICSSMRGISRKTFFWHLYLPPSIGSQSWPTIKKCPVFIEMKDSQKSSYYFSRKEQMFDIMRNLFVGLSGVRALPLGVAAEQSVHNFWDYFSFFLRHILFSQKGLS